MFNRWCMTGIHDSIYEGLAHSCRRVICLYLDTVEGMVTLEEATTHVVTEEQVEDGALANRDCVQRMKTALHHLHLPVLDKADILTYDLSQRSIRADAHLPVAIELIHNLEDLQ